MSPLVTGTVWKFGTSLEMAGLVSVRFENKLIMQFLISSISSLLPRLFVISILADWAILLAIFSVSGVNIWIKSVNLVISIPVAPE